ncbi:MAG: DUF885 domain-containing protein [Eubacteriales bacterium]|nr:DUF885 domain-containing protein [Eubacteriales bacterium]
MHKLKFALIPAACLLLGAAYKYCGDSSARTAAAEFKSFTETMFQNEITSNTLNLHYTLKEPENYGITDYPVTFGETADLSLVAPDASPSVDDYRSILYDISCDSLSLSDRITYDVLSLALENAAEAGTYALYQEPLGPATGVQAQLPILLCEYAFFDKEDVEEYLTLIAQTDTYFASLLQFEKSKARAGLFMSDKNAEAIIAQCIGFLGNKVPEENLLVTIFNEKLQELDFLSESERASYRERNLQAVDIHVLTAYELLASGLESLKGSGKNPNGLCWLPEGKSYYEYLLRSAVGSYLPVDAIERRIRKQLSDDISECRRLLGNDPSAADADAIADIPTDPVEILADLQEKISENYPACPQANVRIEYVHQSLENFLSPAFYLTPPIDNIADNVIYINNASVSSPLELYTTLAHEGYPGHLYQNLSSGSSLNPVRSLFSFGGYTEGWATYVEMESFCYTADTQSEQNAAAFRRLNRSVMLGLSSLLDICIHYRGYTREQTADFLKTLGFANPSAADALYDAIIESPANYLKYYLGCLSFYDLRSYCMENWSEKFDLKDFHKQVLSVGPAPFPVLEKYLKLYYQSA